MTEEEAEALVVNLEHQLSSADEIDPSDAEEAVGRALIDMSAAMISLINNPRLSTQLRNELIARLHALIGRAIALLQAIESEARNERAAGMGPGR